METNYSPAHAQAAFVLDLPAQKAYIAGNFGNYAALKNQQADLYEQAGLSQSAKISRNAAREVLS